jgi:hypothetical protein
LVWETAFQGKGAMIAVRRNLLTCKVRHYGFQEINGSPVAAARQLWCSASVHMDERLSGLHALSDAVPTGFGGINLRAQAADQHPWPLALCRSLTVGPYKSDS